MTEQARPDPEMDYEQRDRMLDIAFGTEQARETPEPLTPERIVKPFTDEHDRAEDHVASMLAAYLDPTDAERAANDVMARLHLSGYDFVKRAALRAATPDPAALTDCEALCYVKCHSPGECEHHAAATPDPAERIEGLRDRAQRQGTWGIEYGDDRFYDDVMAALRAVTPDPADHDRQAVQGTHLFDESCPGCAALSDTTEGQS
jgi:hypothetical protein